MRQRGALQKGKQEMSKEYQFRINSLNDDYWPNCIVTIEAEHKSGAIDKADEIVKTLNTGNEGDELRPPPSYYWAGLQRINNFGN
jgi:hypothetical protein